jgi:predicted Rossmann fold flavoprotein
VTNTTVTDADFWGGRRTIVRRVLRGFPVSDTIAFFREIGVALHEEPEGKLFPDTNRARDVLNALLKEAARTGVSLVTGARVSAVTKTPDGFRVGDIAASRVVLATGGRSLPKSGSDGAGYGIASSLGHTVVPTTPGLVPLVLERTPDGIHRDLTGVAHDAELTLWVDDAVSLRLHGPLLWTHFGISGPVTLNMSRHWLRAALEGRRARLTLAFCPGVSFEDAERWWTSRAAGRPNTSIGAALSTIVPASVATALTKRLGVDAATTLAHLPREHRRTISHALVMWPLDVAGDRGYNHAEVTAGGVSLDEVDPATMQSRQCPGLFLVGEILDVDGRIGGFNFQWAWSSAHVAAAALGT